MGHLPDPLDRYEIQRLRRSIVMLPPGQAANLDRDHALTLLAELQRLQQAQRAVAEDLQAILDRLQGVDRHPSGSGH